MATAAALTIEDFEKLPDALALNHELVDGKLVDVSGNVPKHNWLRELLVRLLQPLARQAGGVIFAEQEYDFGGNAHGPDISLVGAAQLNLINWDRRVQLFVPDMAIEIVSRNDTFESLMKKAVRYRRCGTKEVWLFSIGLRQAMHLSEQRQVLLGEEELFAPEQIPGFSMRIGELLDHP